MYFPTLVLAERLEEVMQTAKAGHVSVLGLYDSCARKAWPCLWPCLAVQAQGIEVYVCATCTAGPLCDALLCVLIVGYYSLHTIYVQYLTLRQLSLRASFVG